MKAKRIIGITMVIAVLMALLAGCGAKQTPVGVWYGDRDRVLSISENGHWEIIGTDINGDWTNLEDGTYFFDRYNKWSSKADFYTSVEKNEYGVYISLGDLGDFYRNEYPAQLAVE